MPQEDWYLHYGLDRDPFAEAGVQGLFYPGGARQESVEQLQHLARFGDCVLLVTGVAGAGKSATLAHFVAQCAPDTRCAVVEVALLDGPEQILRRILAGFGVDAGGSADLAHDLQHLERFCAQCHDQGLLSWLVFDDAQHLHVDALGLLAPLLERTAGRLRLLFFAEPGWEAVLREALPAALVHVIALSAFDRDETLAYIHYRMKTAGLEAEPPFNESELEQIHLWSGGLPGRINGHARQALVEALGVVQRPLSTLPVWHFGVVAVTLLALLLLYAWSAFDDDGGDESIPRPGAAAGAGVTQEPVIVAEEPAPDAAGGMDVAQAQVEPVDADVAQEAPVPDPAAPGPQPTPPLAADSAPALSVAVAEKQPPAAAGVTQEVPPLPAPERAAPPTVQTPSSTDPAAPESPAAGSLSADEDYQLSLDGSLYVLQIMGSEDAAQVRRFATRQSLALRQYSKMNAGKRWYALVHGEFRDRAAAEGAARDIAARLPGTQPWVRRVDAVQREIRQGRARL
jgi:DamX protein